MKNILGLVLLAITMSSCGSKKDTVEISKDFQITIVSINQNEIQLKCTQGCRWNELSFNLQKYQPQGIDAYGLTHAVNTLADVSDRLPDFKFSMERTDNGVHLESIRDTGWNELSFDCRDNCNASINYDRVVP